jgi:hypothetical protein
LNGHWFLFRSRRSDRLKILAWDRDGFVHSRPLLEGWHERLRTLRETLLPKSPMADVVNYSPNQWPELTLFLEDGALPIDNRASEREMKRVVLNRKNSLFVGNVRGGRTAAILSSFTATCRRHGIDPQLYLTQLLVNLPTCPMSNLDAWLPIAGSCVSPACHSLLRFAKRSPQLSFTEALITFIGPDFLTKKARIACGLSTLVRS